MNTMPIIRLLCKVSCFLWLMTFAKLIERSAGKLEKDFAAMELSSSRDPSHITDSRSHIEAPFAAS